MKLGQITRYAVWIGILLILLGFIYDVLFAGIPYQDAPAYLSINYNRNQNIANSMMTAGLVICFVTILIKIAEYLFYRSRSKN